MGKKIKKTFIIAVLTVIASSIFVFADSTNLNETTVNNNDIAETTFDELKDIKNEKALYSLNETKIIDDVEISIIGKFEEEGHLQVKKLAAQNLSKDNIAGSYSYDIKILGRDNNELTPEDKVTISFAFPTIPENIEVKAYHEEELIDTNVTKNEVAVTSDGFSVYTVEFTYKDKEYVLDPYQNTTLEAVLNSVNISGNVESWKSSNPELFDVVEEQGILYLDSRSSFDTKEWLEVTLDGITYKITVTDDQVSIGKGLTNVDIDGVHQGTIDDFTDTIPVASIWIDQSMINMSRTCRDSAEWGHMNGNTFVQGSFGTAIASHAGFIMEDTRTANFANSGGRGSAGYLGNEFLVFDMSLEDLNTSQYSSTAQMNTFNGEVITYRWQDAAEYVDENGQTQKGDVYLTYSDLMLTMEKGVNTSKPTGSSNTYYQEMKNRGYRLGIVSGNMMTLGENAGYTSPTSTSRDEAFTSGPVRYGYWMDVTVSVRDKSGNLINGTYYYPMSDLDVSRLQANGYPTSGSFDNLYGCNRYSSATWDESLHGFSEQVLLKENFGDIYIPGENGTLGVTAPKTSYTNTAYLSQITKNNDGTYLIYPSVGGSNGTQGTGDTETYYSGFVTTGNNTSGGLKLRYFGSSGATTAGMETYMLSGSPVINYKLKSSTATLKSDGTYETDGTVGGTIQTTSTGNHEGDLSNGTVIDPTTIVASPQQRIVYTITPNSGYRLKSVKVANNSLDYVSGSEVSAAENNGTYTYTFTGINSDNAIHVEWEPIETDLTITKVVEENPDDTEFEFKVKVWKDANNMDLSSYGGTDNGDGTYTFTIKAGESVPAIKIPYGYKWEITESSQAGWQLDSKSNDTGEVTDSSPESATSIFTNSRKKAEVQIKKVSSSTNQMIEGAELELWKNGTLADSFTTDGNVYTASLTDGEYTLFERIAPQGYNIAEEISFTVDNGKAYIDGQEISEITMVDPTITARLTINKVDFEDLNNKLPGATFRLWGTSDSGEEVDLTGVTGSNGKYMFDNVPLGTYSLQETETPLGYEKDNTVHTVILADDRTAAERTLQSTYSGRKKAKAVRSSSDIASGTFGTVDWIIDSNGVLTLQPSEGDEGTLDNIASLAASPWNAYRSQITEVKVEGTVHASSELRGLFQNCTNLTKADLTGLDTSDAEHMQAMFLYCSSLTEANPEVLDVSNAIEMQNIFRGTKLTSLDLSSWTNNGKVTNIATMFMDATELQEIKFDFSKFNTENVTAMNSIFRNTAVKTLDLANFKTGSATAMQAMFNGCKNLESVDVSGFDTHSATNMTQMFTGCTALKKIDVTGFDMSNVLTANQMFYQCTSLKELDISGWDLTSATNINSMLNGMTSLQTLNISNVNTNPVIQSGKFQNTNPYLHTLYNLKTLIAENSHFPMVPNGQTNNVAGIHHLPEGVWHFSGTDSHMSIHEIDLANVANGGFLVPGTYTKVASVSEGLEDRPTTDYVITNLKSVVFENEDEAENYFDIWTNGTRTVVYTKPITRVTGESGDMPYDGKIVLRYKDAALDINRNTHDVVIEVDNIVFKDLEKLGNNVPENYRRNVMIFEPTYFGLDNFIYGADYFGVDSANYWKNSKSGTYEDVKITIMDHDDPSQPVSDGTFLFWASDLDVANGENQFSAAGAEGLILEDGFHNDTITLPDDTGLTFVPGYTDSEGNPNYIVGTAGDSASSWSTMYVAAEGSGAKYTWTSGTQCGTTFLAQGGNAVVVDINKIADSAGLTGAKLKIYQENGTSLYSWTSDGNPKSVILNTGSYILREVFAPGGRVLAESIAFEVLYDGSISVNGEVQDIVTMENKWVEVENTITNTRKKGNLTINKTDQDTGELMAGVEFTLTGTSDIGEEINETAITNSSGVASFTNVLSGEYTLHEITPEGYVTASNKTVVIGRDDDTKNVTLNIENERLKYDLVISKVVSGDMGDKNKKFEFKVRAWKEEVCPQCHGEEDGLEPYDEPCEECDGTGCVDNYLNLSPYGGIANGDGSYTFTLKHGEHFEIPNIPYGYSYEVMETDYSSEGYATTVDGNSGRTVSGTMTEDKSHEFENIHESVAPTGIKRSKIYMIIISIILAGVLLTIKKKK